MEFQHLFYRNQNKKNQSNLITLRPKGNILEEVSLREITPKKDRIAHRTQSEDKTWMDEMIKYFDIDFSRINDTRYTVEELKNLQKIVEKYKRQYVIIN